MRRECGGASGQLTEIGPLLYTRQNQLRACFAVSGAGLPLLSLSIAFSLIELLLDRVAIVTLITRVRRNIKAKRLGNEAKMRGCFRSIGGDGPFFIYPTKSAEGKCGGASGQLAGMVPFLYTRQNQLRALR